MGINDRYKLVDHQTFLGQEMTNVYWYQQIDGTDGADVLAQAWVDNVLGSIRAIQHANLTHDTIEVINWDDEADFHQLTLASDNEGMRTGETLPRFNAWGFKIHRPTRAIRSGAKRIPGVAEGDQDGGEPASGILAGLDNLAEVLSEVVVDSGGSKWQLQIVSMSPDGTTILNDVGINEVSFTRLTTQNSRKR